MKRLAVVALIVLISAALVVFFLTTRGEPLNLVIILVDTLRSDHLGYSGYSVATSPRIDDLAKRSLVFTNHYSHSSRTGPSVASLFTGLHPRSHGVVNPLTHFGAVGTLSPDQVTLAEILKENGYRCYGYVTNPNVVPRFGFDQGFHRYDYVQSTSASDVNRMAARALDRAGDGPFFLYLHYLEPHSPYRAPAAYRGKFAKPGYDGPITGAHRQLDEIVGGKLIPDKNDIARLEQLYDEEIRYFDDEFGRLLALLAGRDLLDNTVIVFVADHGEEFWDHGSVLHGYTLYEEQLRVPMFIRDPRRNRAGKIESVTRNVDLLPTLLDMLGIKSRTPVQGRSLIPWIDGTAIEPAVGPVHAQVSLRAVKIVQLVSFMNDGWKLIVNALPEPSMELYDLDNDPGEMRNLFGAEPEMASAMTEQLDAFERSLTEAPESNVELTDEEIRRLRSLGYIK